MAEAFDEAAYRTAVAAWVRDPKNAPTDQILAGARPMLNKLEAARTDVKHLTTLCRYLQSLVTSLREDARRLRSETGASR